MFRKKIQKSTNQTDNTQRPLTGPAFFENFDCGLSVYLSEVFKKEKQLSFSFLSNQQRLDLCIKILEALRHHHQKGHVIGGLAVDDIMVSVSYKSGSIRNVMIRLPAHANTAAGNQATNPPGWKPFDHILPEWMFNESIDAASDISIVGQLFMEIWRIDWPINEDAKLKSKAKIMTDGKILPANRFWALSAMPADLAASIHGVMAAMVQKNKASRPDIDSLITALSDIKEKLMQNPSHDEACALSYTRHS
jgi:hypothetical protein